MSTERARSSGSKPATIKDVEDLFAKHEEREREMFDQILAAFPDGPEKHREYHQKLINAAKAEEEFWHAARIELMKRGITGVLWVLGVVISLVAIGISAKFGFALTLPGPPQ